MKRGTRLFLLAVIVAMNLRASGMSAQASPSTADGVAAFRAVDYQRAAEILGPIADRPPLQADSTADLFMAQLYESGRGAPLDRIRACALYSRASSSGYTQDSMRDPSTTKEPRERFYALVASFNLEELERCELLANLGFQHGFDQRTFDLGAGHWVTVDLSGVIVSQDGKEQRHELNVQTSPGVVFLSVEHTELSVSQPEPERRHFIEIATWMPELPLGQKWTLSWQLFEVVRTSWVEVRSARLTTFIGSEPPREVDLSEMVRLHVGAAGDAELVVMTGPDAATEHLEAESERRARVERAKTRDDADRRVDWNAVRDVFRRPALRYADGDGCATIFLYGYSADRSEAISIHAEQGLLQLSTMPQTLELGTQRVGLEVTVHVYERPVRHWPFCTDVLLPTGPEERWRAIAGSVSIQLANGFRESGQVVLATVRINQTQFVRDDGIRVTQVLPITLTAVVGWVSG